MTNLFLVAVFLLPFVPVASSAVKLATPADVANRIDHAASGEAIRLAPGSYPAINVRDHHWSAPVTVDATAAVLSSVRLDAVSGLIWRGGTFEGGDVIPDAFKVERSDHIVVDAAVFRHYTNGAILIGHTTDVKLTNNAISESGSDGIDIGNAQRIEIDHNRCSDFNPKVGAHPDCVQLFSVAGSESVADVTITNNSAVGDMQGFTAFDGPYDRVNIEYNFARVTNYHGIALFDCHSCTVRHNRVESMPNVKAPEVRAWIKVERGVDVINCDNRAADFPTFPGRNRCKREEDRHNGSRHPATTNVTAVPSYGSKRTPRSPR